MRSGPGRPLIVAHRGGSPDDIENSLAAFDHAIRAGADLVECDLRRVREGTVILYHDRTLTGVPVSSLSLDSLRRAVPTLLTFEAFLARLAEESRPVRVVLDLKEPDIDRAISTRLAADLLAERVIVTTQHVASIRRLSREFPTLRLGLSRGHAASGANPAWLRKPLAALLRPLIHVWLLPQLRWSRATFAVLNHRLVTPWVVRQLHAAGIRVYAWTVDDCPAAKRLAAAGVDLLASNLPEFIHRCLDDYPPP